MASRFSRANLKTDISDIDNRLKKEQEAKRAAQLAAVRAEVAENTKRAQAQREASVPVPASVPVIDENKAVLDYVNSAASVENMSIADIKRAALKAQEEKNKVSAPETKMADRAPTAAERGLYALSSMGKKTIGSAGILLKGAADSVKDAVTNSGNEKYQQVKKRREVLEGRLADSAYDIHADEGIEAPGGEAVTEQAIVRAGIEKAKEQEEKHKSKTVIDENSFGMKTYKSGIEDEEKAMEGLSDNAKQIFGIGLSIADNALTLPAAMISPSLPLYIMSAKAAGGKAYDLSTQGVSAGEAMTRGIVSGGIEALTEKLPLDNIIDAVKIGGKPFIKSVLKEMGAEASEESVSYMLNHIADKAAGDENAEFSLQELAMAALGGAVSGGIMGGGATAVGNAGRALRNNANTLQTAENNGIIEENNIQEAGYAGEKLNPYGRREQGREDLAGEGKEQNYFEGRSGETERTATQDNGKTGLLTEYIARTSFGEKPKSNWRMEDLIIPHEGTVAYGTQTKISEYKAPSFVISDNKWTAKYGDERIAFTANGQVYMRENIPDEYRDMVAPHENTHVMKQAGYMPYLEFIENTPEMLDMNSDIAVELIEGRAKHRNIDVFDMTDEERQILYDEINANMYGLIESNSDFAEYFRPAFKDFDSYAAQLSDIHRQFKKSRNVSVQPAETTDAPAQGVSDNVPQGKAKAKTETISRAERYIKKQEKVFSDKVAKIFGQEMPIGYTDGIIANIKARLQDGGYISKEDMEILFRETADLMSKGYEELSVSVGKPESYKLGDKVSPVDRNNMGVIIELPSDKNGGRYYVAFHNTKKDTAKEKYFTYEELNPYVSSTEEAGINDLYNVSRDTYREDLYEFSKALDKFSMEYAEASEYIVKDMTPEETEERIREFKTLYEHIHELERKLKQIERNAALKTDEESIVEGLLRGTQKFEDILPKYDIDGILKVYDAKKALAESRKEINEFNKHRKFELRAMAADHLENMWDWKDKKSGFRYKRETMERNFHDVIPDEAEAKRIIAEYITTVHKSTANVNRLKNAARKKVKALNLSDKRKHYVEYMNGEDAITGAVSERTLVQLLGEGKITDADVIKSGADLKKIKDAVDTFRSVYNGLIDQMNNVLMRNGYKPVEYRKDYFPHFEEDKPDTLFRKAAARLGMKIKADKLPTEIAGTTHTRRPGKVYFGNAMQRTGVRTEYDAVKGFDSYINGIAEVIYYTDDIQKLRALENEIRYETSQESVRKEIDKVMSDNSLGVAERQTALDALYNQDQTHLSNLAVHLREYTDSLANKKSIDDRTIEHMVGRGFYDGVKQIESRFSANMVGLNIRSNLTNFIPITQAISNLHPLDVVHSMSLSMQNLFKDDGFTDKSTFLTNRAGSDILSKTSMQKGVDAAGALLSWIDAFSSNVIVRAKYMENLRNGMDEGSAMDNADDFAASVIADRSKGALPTIFNSKNPIIKAFTAFQVEVNNQVSYYTKDIPRISKEEKKNIVWAMTKTAVASYLINRMYEWLFGDTPAFDPVGLAVDFVDKIQKDEITTYEAVLNLGKNIVEDVPFVGSWAGGGRVPYTSALPEWDNVKTILNPETPGDKRKELVLKETGKMLTNIVMPVGGAQLRKTAEGLSAYAKGGSYTYNSKGEKTMRFPIEQTGDNAWRAALFGQYATDEGKDYIDNGFDGFSAEETDIIEMLESENNIERQKSSKALQEISALTKTADKQQYIFDLPWTREEKQELHDMLFDTKTYIDYTDENSFKISTAIDSASSRTKAEKAVRLGVDVDKMLEFYETAKNTEGVKYQGKTIPNSRRKAVERVCEKYAKNEGQFIALMQLADFTYDSELYKTRKVPS